jgi:hypothetical protein
MDLYVFGTPYRLMWDWYFLGRHHTETVSEWHENEREFVETRGLSVFLMPAGMLGTLKSMWDVFPLFANTGEAFLVIVLAAASCFVRRVALNW